MANKDRIFDHGVWPTMVTPLTETGEIDYAALNELVDWYVNQGVHGLFAVCQSSEMFFLSLRERVALAEATVKAAAGRVPVIASGHISDGFEAQVEELSAIAATGVDAVVVVNNRFAAPNESDDVWKTNAERVIARFPEDVPLGVYECPHPYKREFSIDVLSWCIGTGRFAFFKDTCCDLELIEKRAKVAAGSGFALFNANSASFLYSLKLGYRGYSGVMANFHPAVYVRLLDIWKSDASSAAVLQDFATCASRFEGPMYPANAKYYLNLEGIAMSTRIRRAPSLTFSSLAKDELRQLRDLTTYVLSNAGVAQRA